MLVGWRDLIKDFFVKKKVNDEFISYNARRVSEPDPSYEMLGSKKCGTTVVGTPVASSPGMLGISPSKDESAFPKSYQQSRHSSMVSSNPNSPGKDKNGNSGGNLQFTAFPFKGEAVSEDEGYVHHALTPKPPSASHRKK